MSGVVAAAGMDRQVRLKISTSRGGLLKDGRDESRPYSAHLGG